MTKDCNYCFTFIKIKYRGNRHALSNEKFYIRSNFGVAHRNAMW